VSWLTVALWIAALAGLAAIAVIDARRRIIPNELVLATLGVGVVLRLTSASGMLGPSAAAAVGILLLLGVIAHFGVLGGGDVKLIPAVSLLAPADHVLPLMFDVAVAGGVLSMAYLVSRPSRKAAASPSPGFAVDPSPRAARPTATSAFDDSVPYGMAVSIGVAFYFAEQVLRCLSATSCSL
jgi:prepilin peptidase CpaA